MRRWLLNPPPLLRPTAQCSPLHDTHSPPALLTLTCSRSMARCCTGPSVMVRPPSALTTAPVVPVTPAAPPLHVAPPYRHLSPMRLTQATPPHLARLRPSLLMSLWRPSLPQQAVCRYTTHSMFLRGWLLKKPLTSMMKMLLGHRNQLPRTHRFPNRSFLWRLLPGRSPLNPCLLLVPRWLFLL